MMQVLITVGVAMVGALVSVQAAINARLGAALQVPIASALWNFCLGSVVLALLVVSGVFGRPAVSHMTDAPWWAWLGGMLGAIFVTTTIVAVPRVGTTTTFGAVVCGQFICALAIDTFGWLGVESIPLSPWRLLGVGCLILGVLLIQQ